ncbi:MAG: S9 family peptidase [Chloroflexota bacterium]
MTDSSSNEALAPEAIADLMIPSELRMSPDGAAAVFTAVPLGQPGEFPASAVWLAAAGVAARKLTHGEASDRSARWSPDGRTVAFLSDRLERGKRTALYLLPMAGGEASRLGELEGALDAPEWSPDGSMLAVLRTDPTDPAREAREKERDDPTLVEQHPQFTRLWVVDSASGKARCLTFAEREVRSYCWKPDGSGLIAVTTALPGADEALGPADIWDVPAAGGIPRRLAGFPSLTGSPVVRGERIYLTADGQRGDPPTNLWSLPLPGGDPRKVGGDFAGEAYAVLPRGEGVALIGVERVYGKLFATEGRGGKLREATPAPLRGRGSVMEASYSADGRKVAVTWSSSDMPEEVWLGEAGGEVVQATSFGEKFAGKLRRGEIVRWNSTDGLEVEGILIRPDGAADGAPAPLVVEIHGGPSWQWQDRAMLSWHDWAQMLASMGIAVLLPNPRGSTGYGAEFQARLQDDVGGGEAQDLISGALAMVERGIADPERLGVGGWSWGGYLTARVISQTTVFKAAVMGAGLANMISDHGTGDIPRANLLFYPGHPYEHMDHYWQSSPIRDVSKVTTPTLILHGDSDERVHPAQGAEFFRALKVLGVPVEFVRYPREGHGVGERLHQIDLMRRVAGWYRRWLLEA